MPISRRELVKRLRKLGFGEPEPGGGHEAMRKGRLKITIPNPHGGKDIGDALLTRILRQAGVSREDFDNLR